MQKASILCIVVGTLGLISSSALAQQDGNWKITNMSVGEFAGWAATSGVEPRTGDFNGDGRDDIALVRHSAGWSTIPIAFAQGDGRWMIANTGGGEFAGWATANGVATHTGDFNGDGFDDIALVRHTAGWSTIPIAFAQGDGGWRITNANVGEFAGWSSTPGVSSLTGDFNSDGRDDIALVRHTAGWSTIPVAFAQGDGGWRITNADVGEFSRWLASAVETMTGDFNGDGFDDIALVRHTAGWSTIPVAFAQGDGGWRITNADVGAFAGWATTNGVEPRIGDFNSDGRDDIALIREAAGWNTLPVAFAQGDGSWNITNAGVGEFADWVATSGVETLIGDFNDDGRDDIALTRRSAGWSTLPVAFAQGDGGWKITNAGVGEFAGWVANAVVSPLIGDFDRDGRDDIALVRGSAGWNTVPVAFATNMSPQIPPKPGGGTPPKEPQKETQPGPGSLNVAVVFDVAGTRPSQTQGFFRGSLVKATGGPGLTSFSTQSSIIQVNPGLASSVSALQGNLAAGTWSITGLAQGFTGPNVCPVEISPNVGRMLRINVSGGRGLRCE